MTVDYVRVYSRSKPGNCGVNGLTNPGCEMAELQYWTSYGNSIGNTLVARSNRLPVPGGSKGLKVCGQFNGSENYSGGFRETYITPGASDTAHGW